MTPPSGHLRLSPALPFSPLARWLEPVSQMSNPARSLTTCSEEAWQPRPPLPGKAKETERRLRLGREGVELKGAEEYHILRIIHICRLEGKELVLVLKQTFLSPAVFSLLIFSPTYCFHSALYRLFANRQCSQAFLLATSCSGIPSAG